MGVMGRMREREQTRDDACAMFFDTLFLLNKCIDIKKNLKSSNQIYCTGTGIF